MWWAKELFSSLRFLAVHGDRPFWKSKRVYEIVLPVLVTAALSVAFFLWPKAFSPTILGRLSGSIFQFMVFVVPFHLAALGAFATFDSEGLDQKLQGTNSQIRVWNNEDNGYFYQTLTLRQYASLLFGYLCSIGVVFIAIYVIADNVNFSFVAGDYYRTLYVSSLILVLLFITHYVFLSIYAITFLFDKVNRIGAYR